MKSERLISFALLAALLITAYWTWYFWRDANSYREALAISRRTIAKRNATIDQQAKIIQAWVEANPPGDVEGEDGKKMGAGGRILPAVKDLTRETQEAVIEVREFVRDVKEGRLGAHVSGSLWKGEADVSLRRVEP